ncbi:MAG: right-handed parallel beta-helix repeat-containing protein [Acidimicrobiales bacterium]
MRGIRRVIGGGCTLALLLLGLVVAGPAQAANVSCGQVITQSTTLNGNVGPCQVGIRIGADNIVLNLNGFTVSGTAGQGEEGGIVVLNRSGVTIRNGTVTGFDTGVYVESSTRTMITGMNVTGNVGQGIFDEGIQLYLSDRNTIFNNDVTENGHGAGIALYDSSYNTIDRNRVENNNIRGIDHTHGSQQNIGIRVFFLGDRLAPTTGNVVSNNLVRNNGLDGIQFSRFTQGNTAKGNTVLNNGLTGGSIRDGDGIAVFGRQNFVQDNEVRNNGQSGIHVYVGGTGNYIQRNVAFGNNAGPNPDAQFDLRDDNPSCDATLWMGNQFGTRNQSCIN